MADGKPPANSVGEAATELVSRTGYKHYVWPSVQSAIATSGAGTVYQNAVGGYLLAYLAATAPFGKFFAHGNIVRVAFQQRLSDLMLDDVVIDVQLADTIIERVAFQITLDLEMIPSNDKYRAILGACLHTFDNNKPYYYGFITRADTSDLWRLTLSAQTRADDPEKWLQEVKEPNNFDQNVRRALDHLCNGLAPHMRSKQQPNAQELVAFLERFLPVSLNVGGEGDDQGLLLRTVLGHRYGLSETDAQLLLDALTRTAEQGGQYRHNFTQEKLRKYVTRHHGPWLNEQLPSESVGLSNAIAEAVSRFAMADQQAVVTVERALLRQSELQGRELRELVVDDVAKAEVALRRGLFSRVRELLSVARREASWESLNNEDKARVTLIEARLALVCDDDFDGSEQLLQTAKSFHASDSTTKFEAQLLIERAEFDRAFQLVESIDAPWRGQVLAVISLVRNDPDAAEHFLADAPDDIESRRLRALAALRLGRKAEALAHARSGFDLDPENDGIKNIYGIIAFNAALLDGMPAVMGPVPVPIPRAFIRGDNEGRKLLQIAEAMFSSLPRDQRRKLEQFQINSWLLTSLIAADTRREEAETLLSRLLLEHPGEPFIVGWALMHHLDFDRRAAIKALRTATAATAGDIPEIQSLVALEIEDGNKEEAVTILRRYREKLHDAGAGTLYRVLLSEAGVSEDYEAADSSLGSIDDRRLTLTVQGQATGDWEPLVDFLRAQHATSPSSATLLELATALDRQKAWPELAGLATKLLASGSETATVYALQSLYNSDRLTEYIEAYESISDKSKLNHDHPEFLAATASALERLGRLRDALSTWFTVSQQAAPEQKAKAAVAQLRIYSTLGDAVGVQSTTDQLLAGQPMSGVDLLSAASLAESSSRDAAVQLWRAAVAVIPDAAAPAALSLGYRLGLDAEPIMEQLTRTMEALAERGEAGIQRIAFGELGDKVREWRDAASAGVSAYAHGDVPVHILYSTILPGAISDLWEAAFRGAGSIFIRYAGRASTLGLAPKVNLSLGRIGLDTTAILTLQHLNILADLLEDGRVRFSSASLVAIDDMRNKAAPPQPSMSFRRRRLYERIRSGTISMVDSCPDDAFSVTASADQQVLVELVYRMQRSGLLGSDPVTVLRRMGLPLSYDGPNAILPEALYLDALATVMLESADVLDALITHRVVYTSRETEEAVLRDVRDDDDRRRKKEWLTGLHNALAAKMDGHLIPDSVTDNDPNAAIRAIGSLVNNLNDPYDAVIVDDRMISSFATTDKGVQVCTTFELIQYLYGADPEKLSSLLARLREANTFFLPVEPDEIVTALLTAPLDESGAIIETPPLIAIRRYVAEAVFRKDVLRRPSPIPNAPFPLGEAPYLMELSRITTDALSELWGNRELEEKQRIAGSDWILEELYSDDLPEVHVMRLLAPGRSDAEVVATGLAILIYRALAIVSRHDVARSYLDFIVSRIFRHRLRLDPHVIPTLASKVADAFRATIETGMSTGRDPRVALIMIYRIFERLPKNLQDALSNIKFVKDALQIQFIQSVSIGGVRFDANIIWNAVADAFATSSTTTAQSSAPSTKWTISIDGAVVHLSSREHQINITDEAIGVLRASVPERLNYLSSVASTFDVRVRDREVLFNTIASSATPAEFMAQLSDARKGNIELQCASLADAFMHGPVEVDEALPDDLAVIAQYLRLPRVSEESGDDRGAAIQLLEDCGLEGALRRSFLLPVPLPNSLLATWQTTSAKERRQIAERLRATCITPLDRAHLRRLLSTEDYTSRRTHLKELDTEILAFQDGVEVSGQQAVVEWARRLICLRATAASELTEKDTILAAWIYGGLLYRELRRRQADAQLVAGAFNSYAEQTVTQFTTTRGELADDPQHSGRDVIAHLFAYAYGHIGWPTTAAVRSAWATFFVINSPPIVMPAIDIYPAPQTSALPDTFLGDDLRPVIRSIFPEAAVIYEDVNRRQMLDSVLAQLDNSPASGLLWALLPMLWDLVGNDDLNRLRAQVAQFDVFSLLQGEEQRKALMIALTTKNLLSSPELRVALRAKLLSATSDLAKSERPHQQPRITDDDRDRIGILQECAMRLSFSSESAQRLQTEAYVELTREMGARWPKVLRVLRPHVVHWARTLPLGQGSAFGPLILDCRRTP